MNKFKGIAWAIRLGVVWIFVAFSWGKLWEPASFAEAIFRYRMLPDVLINPMALFLPWLEFWCALALFLPFWRRAAWNWLILLLVVFTVAKASVLFRGLDVSCGCHGASGEGEFIRWQSIAFNLLILAGCGVARCCDSLRVKRMSHTQEYL